MIWGIYWEKISKQKLVNIWQIVLRRKEERACYIHVTFKLFYRPQYHSKLVAVIIQELRQEKMFLKIWKLYWSWCFCFVPTQLFYLCIWLYTLIICQWLYVIQQEKRLKFYPNILFSIEKKSFKILSKYTFFSLKEK